MIHKSRGGKGLLVLVGVLILGAFFSWSSVTQADNRMREDLLLEAKLTAEAVSTDILSSFTGTDADLANPRYERLKNALSTIRSNNPKYRFVYLLSRKTDGTVYVMVDSEDPASPDYSPPGQVYEEVPAVYSRVFDTARASVEGPVTDRWGRWVSALVPVVNVGNGAETTVLGIDIDASTWNSKLLASALPPILFTLVLFSILLISYLLYPARHLYTGMVASLGLVLTTFASWAIYAGGFRNAVWSRCQRTGRTNPVLYCKR